MIVSAEEIAQIIAEVVKKLEASKSVDLALTMGLLKAYVDNVVEKKWQDHYVQCSVERAKQRIQELDELQEMFRLQVKDVKNARLNRGKSEPISDDTIELPEQWRHKGLQQLAAKGFTYSRKTVKGRQYMILRRGGREKCFGRWSQEMEDKLFTLFPRIKTRYPSTPTTS